MTASTTWLIRAGLLVLPVLLALLDRKVSVGRPVPLARLGQRAIEDQQVPMVSGVLLVLLALLDLVVLMELLALSGQREIWGLPGPRVGLDHKAHLVRRVMLETVVLLESVERLVLLALLVQPVSAALLVKVVTSSGTRSRWTSARAGTSPSS